MVFVYTAMGVLCVEHANVLKLYYIELLSGDGSFRLCSLSLVNLNFIPLIYTRLPDLREKGSLRLKHLTLVF